MDVVKITSGGTAQSTTVKVGDQELPNIVRIAIDVFEPGDLVTATITLQHVSLELLAEAKIVIEGIGDATEEHY